MAHPNEDLIREGLAHLERGDVEAFSRDLAPDIRWHFPGRHPLAGHHEGADQVGERFRRMGELSGGTYRMEVHDVIGNDEHVVALHTTRAEREGRQLEVLGVQVFHVRDGKVREVWSFHGDPPAVDEFWS